MEYGPNFLCKSMKDGKSILEQKQRPRPPSSRHHPRATKGWHTLHRESRSGGELEWLARSALS